MTEYLHTTYVDYDTERVEGTCDECDTTHSLILPDFTNIRVECECGITYVVV